MSNLIQIKRSDETAIPVSLAEGELAYSFNSNSLFIGGNASNVIRIGGGNYLWLHQSNTGTPGALTANAVVITNGNSYVTEWRTNKLVVGNDGTTTNVTSISLFANSSQLGASAGGSNTELVSSWAVKTYVDTRVGVVGATQVAFGNSSGGLTSDAQFTYDTTTDSLAIGSIVLNGTTNIVNATAFNAGANVNISTGGISIGNSSVNVASNSTQLVVNGTIVNSSIVQVAGEFRGYTANVTTSIDVGSNVDVNTSAVFIGNSTVNSILTSSSLKVDGTVAGGNTTITGFANISSTANVGGATTLRSTLTVNGAVTIANTLATGNTTITGFANISSTANVGGAVNLRSTLTVNGAVTIANTLGTGNTTVTGFANVTTTLQVGGATTVGTTLAAGNTTITGFANVSSTLNVVGAATVNGAATINNTLATGNTTVTGFANVTSSLQVGGAATIGTTLAAGNTTVTGFANVTSSLQVGGAATIGTTLAAGNTTVTGFANVTGHLTANSLSVGDTTISGNLTVTGTLTTVSANNITITDPMIQLAANNTLSDVLDIGLFGSYEAGDLGNHEHTGLFRDASDSGTWKLFEGLEVSPTTTVDTANVTFAFATLQTFLKTGGSGLTGLIANSTTIALTANSTLNVAIVANTLTLSTPLAGTSGGTGLSALTAEQIIVANSSNGFRTLSLGTAGQVLQSNGSALVYATLDGGAF